MLLKPPPWPHMSTNVVQFNSSEIPIYILCSTLPINFQEIDWTMGGEELVKATNNTLLIYHLGYMQMRAAKQQLSNLARQYNRMSPIELRNVRNNIWLDMRQLSSKVQMKTETVIKFQEIKEKEKPMDYNVIQAKLSRTDSMIFH